MSDVTKILSAVTEGDRQAAEQLLPLVYDELRRLAAQRLVHERRGHAPQATSLVHEAYLRLVGGDEVQHFHGRGHFFAAAAEAMRRILVERARRRRTDHRVVDAVRKPVPTSKLAAPESLEELLAVHDVLDKLAAVDQLSADLVKLRYFAGLTMEDAAIALGMRVRTAERTWTYARSWLHRELKSD